MQINFAINATLFPFLQFASQSVGLSLSLKSRLCPLLVVQQWSSLLVCWNNVLLTPECELLPENAWECNSNCGNEEDAHDDESKDPLERDGLREELTDAKGSSQDAECEANSVVLYYVSN